MRANYQDRAKRNVYIFSLYLFSNPTTLGSNSKMGTGQNNPFDDEPVDPTHLQVEAHAAANVQITSRTTTSLENPFELF